MKQCGTLCRGWLVFVLFLSAACTLSFCFSSNVMAASDHSGYAATNVYNLPRESGLVGDNSLKDVQKYNGIDVGGNLNVNIPLFSIPGKIPVDLNLSYKSGIKIDQKAGWVGLGWNLANWSVRRIPVHGDDIHSYNYVGSQNRTHVNDHYVVSIPGRTMRFYNDGTQGEPHFISSSQGTDSLVAFMPMDTGIIGTDTVIFSDTVDMEHPAPYVYWKYIKYDYFVMVDDNATKYVFKFPLRQASLGGIYRDNMITYYWYRLDSLYTFENAEWLLTAILSHDYVDGGGEPLVPNDGGEDKGSWVKFRYTGDGSAFGNTRILVMGSWLCSGTFPPQYHHDSVEVAYLKEIETPTVEVRFSLRSVLDSGTVRYWRSGEPGGQWPHVADLLLTKMTVHRKASGGPTPELYGVAFNYEEPGKIPLKTAWHRYFDRSGTGCQLNYLHGEPTLRSISIGTHLRYNPPRQLAKETLPHGLKKTYTFAYDQELDALSGYCSSHSSPEIRHGRNHTDWLNGRDRDTGQVLAYNYPASNSALIDPEWVHDTAQLSHRVWGDRDWFGYFYLSDTTSTWYTTSPWSLTKMTVPEGLVYEYEYDQDEYNINFDDYSHKWRSAGGRVKGINVNPSPDSVHADCVESAVYSVSYGYNNDGLGFATSMPGNFHSYITRYDFWTCNYFHPDGVPRPGYYLKFLSDHASHEIQYPRITWHLPNDRGTIEYYYHVAEQAEQQNKLLTMTADEFPAGGGQSAEMKYGIWLDRSPILGKQYKTVMRNSQGAEVYFKQDFYTTLVTHENRTPVDTFSLFPVPFEPDDTLAATYFRRLDSTVFRKDGVQWKREYGWEGNPLWRLAEVTDIYNDYSRKTVLDYQVCDNEAYYGESRNLGPDCYVYPSPMHIMHYFTPLKTISTWRSVGSSDSLEQRQEFTYADAFPSQNKPNTDSIWYMYESKEWVDLDDDSQIDGSELLITRVLDVDKYGNARLVQFPNGIKHAYIYSHHGLGAEFRNVAGYNFAFCNGQGDLDQQPGSWSNIDNIGYAFGGAAGQVIESASGQDPANILTLLPGGTYIADGWAWCDQPNQLKLLMEAKTGITVTASTEKYVTQPDVWQRLVCTLVVTQNQTLVCSWSSHESTSSWVDDIRIYPPECLVRSWTYDAIGRATSASDYNNMPTRFYYDQYGDAATTADFRHHPLSGQLTFFKSTEAISGNSPLRYRSDMPNSRLSLQCQGKGLVWDPSHDPTAQTGAPFGSTLTGNGNLSVTNLTFSSTGNTYTYNDLLIPVDTFENGFMSFEVFDTTVTGCSYANNPTGLEYTNLWFGFENASSQGYGMAISRDRKFHVFRYDGDYDNPGILESTVVGDWSEMNNQGRRQYMIGKLGNSVYFFYNNDCVYRFEDSTYAKLHNLKFRFQNPRDNVGCSDTVKLYNLVCYSEPEITTEFINSFGAVKQVQQFDGENIIVSGKTVRADFAEEAQFKPIFVDPGAGTYGGFGALHPPANPFDFVDEYLNSSFIYSWSPGSNLNTSSFVYSYYDEAATPNCRDTSNLLAPYAETIFHSEPLMRLQETRYAGVFRHHPTKYSYGTSESALDGFDSLAYAAGTVFKETVTDENGHMAVTYKDKAGNTLVSYVDGSPYDLAYTRFYPDFNGNDTLVMQPGGQQIRRKFNNLGWLVFDSTGDYGIETYEYDRAANRRFTLTASNRASNQFKYMKYDAHDRVAEEGSYFYSLDSMNWLTANNPSFPQGAKHNVLIENIYDSTEYNRGLLSQSVRYPTRKPDSVSWEAFTYDEYGRLSKTDQFVYLIDHSFATGRTVEAEFDLAGRTTKLTYNNGTGISYFHNSAGQMDSLRHESGSTNHFMMAFDYWPTGQTKARNVIRKYGEITVPSQHVDYTYNARNWLETINDGTVESSTTGSGDHFSLKLTYDSAGYPGPSGIYDSAFYNGNIASYTLRISPGTTSDSMTLRFSYDVLDRLRWETKEGESAPSVTEYNYHPNGNVWRIFNTTGIPQHQYYYQPGSNRVDSVAFVGSHTVRYMYTPSGSITAYDTTRPLMEYNALEQLKRRSRRYQYDPAGDWSYVEFWYNASGQRIAKSHFWHYQYLCSDPGQDPGEPGQPISMAPADATSSEAALCEVSKSQSAEDQFAGSHWPEKRYYKQGPMLLADVGPPPGRAYCTTSALTYTGYYYFGDDVMMEYTGPNEDDLKAYYVYANGQRVAKVGVDTNDVRFYLTDHLGSTVATIGWNGNLRNKYFYLPFGRLHRFAVSDFNQLMYTGQMYEDEIAPELYYYGARYYDPELRMFLQVDPRRSDYPSWSPYTYALDNPMKFIDPDGEAMILPERQQSQDESPVESFLLDLLWDMAHDPVPGPSAIKGVGKSVVRAAAKAGAKRVIQKAGSAGKTGDQAAKESLVGPKGGTSWTTARRQYWKQEAKNNPGRFTKKNLQRAEKGLAEQRKNKQAGKTESKHLHHVESQKKGGKHVRSNLREKWPEEHYEQHRKPREVD